MAKKKEIEQEDFEVQKPLRRRKKKEKNKPWGKTERLVTLFVLVATVSVATVLSLSARAWKLPNTPRLTFPDFKNFSLFKEQTVVVGNHGSQTDQEKIEKIKLDFKNATDGYSGIYAFYIYDLNGDYYYGVNGQETLQAASLIKLPVMSLAFKKLESGEWENLSQISEDEALSLLEAMGKKSDNKAFLEMVEILGEVEITAEIKNLGLHSTSFDDNQTTPEDIGIFFKKLYNKELLSEKYTNLLLQYLTDTIYEDWLTPGVPEGVVVSHKYGREIHSVSDAGIIFSTKPFVIVIMTDGVVEDEADNLFPTLSKLLYDGHTDEITN